MRDKNRFLSHILNKIINGKDGGLSVAYNSTKKIGFLSGILKNNYFNNVNEYREYYYKNYLSAYDLMSYANTIFEEVGKKYSTDGITKEVIYEYLDDLIFTKTWKGIVETERLAVDYLMEKGCHRVIKAINIDASFETKYAIDLFAYYDKDRYGIQVKPESFLDKKYKHYYTDNLKKNFLYMDSHPEVIKAMVYLYFNKNGKHLKSQHMSVKDIKKLINEV